VMLPSLISGLTIKKCPGLSTFDKHFKFFDLLVIGLLVYGSFARVHVRLIVRPFVFLPLVYNQILRSRNFFTSQKVST